MANDFLKPILGDELYAQVEEKLNGMSLANLSDGSHIPKAKFDDVNSKAKSLTSQVNTLTAQLEAAKAANGDTDALNARIAQLTNDVAERDSKLTKLGMQYRIKDELRGLNVRDVETVMPLLKNDEIKDKDGKLEGLAEQVEGIKKAYPYLFTDNSKPNMGFNGNQNIGGTDDVNSQVNSAIRSMFGRTI